MAGWHHWLNGREFEWTPGDGDGQGGLACRYSWGRKESGTTERLNWTELNWGENLDCQIKFWLYLVEQEFQTCMRKYQLSLVADTFRILFICSLIPSVGVKNSQRAFSLFFISFISTFHLKVCINRVTSFQLVIDNYHLVAQTAENLPAIWETWVGKIPQRRKRQPTPVFLLENPMDRGYWWVTLQGVAQSWIRLRDEHFISFHLLFKKCDCLLCVIL